METPNSNSNDSDENPNQLREEKIDAVANSLSSMLSSVITDFESKAQGTMKSQDYLNSTIDRLTRELDQLLEDAPLPFIMQHAAKISAVRKRVSSLNLMLKSIQRRLDNIDRMLSVGVPQGISISSPFDVCVCLLFVFNLLVVELLLIVCRENYVLILHYKFTHLFLYQSG
ncbi:SNARE-associated protein-related [Euphorbia peplus]|nr:SNARE-associated protein-related [Euphorbia peplus]